MSKINIKNIKSFIKGHYNLYLDQLGLYPKYKQEQILYRISLCGDCVEKKGCQHCGCPPHKKVYDERSCNGGDRYPDMMSEVKWDKFKLDNKIGIDDSTRSL